MDNFDKKYCESVDEISDETQIRYDEIAMCTHYNTAFDDFYFNKNEVKRKNLSDEYIDDYSEERDLDINNDIDNIKDIEYNKENNKNNVNTNDILKKNSDYINYLI